jgi:nucleotide-binding universal stress UspA family protein
MKVLVAIDHSSSSDLVLQAATTYTWPTGTTFCVLNVVNLLRFERLRGLIEQATRESERLVTGGVKQIHEAGYEAFSTATSGYPRSDIACFAKEWGADLILVGSHGHGPIGRFLLGSIAQAVLRTAPCSVEIVRTPPKSRAVPRKVLLATDGSDCSIEAAHAIAAEIWPQGSVFKLLSVEESLIVGNETETAYPNSLIEELIAMAQDRARSAVEQAKDILQRAGLTVDDTSSAPAGEPRSLILDKAKKWGADLIVLGSHGRRGLDRLLVGSVSEAVAVHASSSVRVVRARQHSKGNSHAD